MVTNSYKDISREVTSTLCKVKAESKNTAISQNLFPAKAAGQHHVSISFKCSELFRKHVLQGIFILSGE